MNGRLKALKTFRIRLLQAKLNAEFSSEILQESSLCNEEILEHLDLFKRENKNLIEESRISAWSGGGRSTMHEHCNRGGKRLKGGRTQTAFGSGSCSEQEENKGARHSLRCPGHPGIDRRIRRRRESNISRKNHQRAWTPQAL